MKRLILLGGGHAHVKVLADLADRPLDGWTVQLVTPFRRQIYSGMLPGWIAGHYPIEACAIALDALAGRAGVTFHETAATALDADGSRLECADGATRSFDLLSVDTGPVAALDQLPGAAEHTVPIRPIERFVAAWPALADRILARCLRFDLVVLGAGAGGVELAFAIAHRAARDGWSHLHVALVGSQDLPLDGAPAAARRRTLALLRQRGIAWHGSSRATHIEGGRIARDGAAPIPFDACLLVTGAAAPAWPTASGLATDDGGFIRIGPTLQSVSHPNIFAAGDIASHADALPRSGVYAVRAGPVLSDNIRAAATGATPRPWRPQRRALYLVSMGNRSAMAIWGRWSWCGRWVWHWKDRIDRCFVSRFT